MTTLALFLLVTAALSLHRFVQIRREGFRSTWSQRRAWRKERLSLGNVQP